MGINLDINWDQISRASDEMINNFGEDALAEAESRAQNMRSAGRYSAAVTWENICQLIKERTPLNIA
jgi:predicted DNA-binding WGR domain protein